jgi:hypothetical protein
MTNRVLGVEGSGIQVFDKFISLEPSNPRILEP